jgi:hypothetical protein
MSAAEQKETLQQLVGAALGALHGLDEDQRAVDPDAFALLERVVSHARLVVDQTAPELIATSAAANLTNAITPIATDPVTASASASAQIHADTVLGTLGAFPAAQGRDIEQAAGEVLASFERSAGERLAAFHAQATDAESQLATLSTAITDESARLTTEISSAAATVQATVDALATAAQATFDGLVAQVQTQRQMVEDTQATQNESFSTSQGERATAFQDELTKIRTELAELQESAQTEVESRVEEIRRMEREAGGLAGSIALAGTADRYKDEAEAQKKVADFMRVLTFAFAIGAVVMAIVAATHKSGEWNSVGAKLAVSVVFGGLATYTGKQSQRHRTREERARNLQLELTAFGPFIEPLDKDQQDFERVIMTRKTFGQIAALPEADDDHAFGPLGPVELLRNKLLPGSDKTSA